MFLKNLFKSHTILQQKLFFPIVILDKHIQSICLTFFNESTNILGEISACHLLGDKYSFLFTSDVFMSLQKDWNHMGVPKSNRIVLFCYTLANLRLALAQILLNQGCHCCNYDQSSKYYYCLLQKSAI